MYVFVYGTLLKGESNHRVIVPFTEDTQPGAIQGTLYDFGPHPFLVLSQTGVVHGEWVKIKGCMERQALHALDQLEGYREGSTNNLYDRVIVRDLTQAMYEGYVYVYPDGTSALDIRKYPIIVNGNWRDRDTVSFSGADI